MKKLLAVTVAVVAASGANADWVSGATANPAGELMLTVWDSVQEKAFSQDLGILTADAIAGNIANGYTVSLAATGLAHLGSFSNLSWNLAGADQSFARYDTVTNRTNNGIYATNGGVAPSRIVDPLGDAGLIDGYFGVYDTKIMMGNTAANPVVLSSGNLTHAGEGNIWGASMGGLVADLGMTTTAGVNGQTLETWIFTGTADTFTGFIEKGGSWTLDANAATLIYAAPSAVPVPAAAWLFGSALISLASVGRRRKV